MADVQISGSFADSPLLAGGDGMTYLDGKLYVVFTSELVQLTSLRADALQRHLLALRDVRR